MRCFSCLYSVTFAEMFHYSNSLSLNSRKNNLKLYVFYQELEEEVIEERFSYKVNRDQLTF